MVRFAACVAADLALVSERVGEIRELPGKYQQLHFTAYLNSAKGGPAPNNTVGLCPESPLERYTQLP